MAISANDDDDDISSSRNSASNCNFHVSTMMTMDSDDIVAVEIGLLIFPYEHDDDDRQR